MVARQLWTPEETGLLTRGLHDTLREARGGTDFDGKQRETVHNFWDVDSPHRATEGSTGVAAAAFVEDDPRLLSKVEQILGPGFEGSFNGRSNNDGNVYVGSTMWHADMGWDPKIPTGRRDPLRKAAAEGTANDNANLHMFPSIKVAFYLEPVTAESGALRVVPASHRSPLHEACWSLHSGIPARVSDEDSARQAAELTRMAGKRSGRLCGWFRCGQNLSCVAQATRPRSSPTRAPTSSAWGRRRCPTSASSRTPATQSSSRINSSTHPMAEVSATCSRSTSARRCLRTRRSSCGWIGTM